MWARLFINKHGYLHPVLARFFANLYCPFVGAGIRIKKIAPDYRYVRVEMPITFYNRNYVGTQFGGSIYAMTDPFYMLMLIQTLGREYIVWDKAAKVDFIKPGRSRLHAEFRLAEEDLETIRQATAQGEKFFYDRDVELFDASGELVARVTKTLYIRRKKPLSPKA